MGKENKPNIIVIMADDLGCCDLGCYGNPYAQTPNIDRLAATGMRLEHHYSASPVCAPARAGFLTGRHPNKVGATDLPSNRGMTRVNPNENTLPKALKTIGYRTALVGKWHNGGGHRRFHPNNYGYDEFVGFEAGGSPYFNFELEREWGDVEHVTDQYLTDRLTDEAISFVERCGDTPFHLNLAYNAPHRPLEVPEEDYERFAEMEGVTKGIKLLYAMVARLDWNIGRLVRHLEVRNLRRNTLILFVSDNGPDPHGEGELAIKGRPCHLFNGMKYDVLEGGVRVPAILNWPGVIPAGTINSQPSIFMDWFPTFAALTGVEPELVCDVDGHDIWPVLMANSPGGADYYWHWTRYQLIKHSNMAVYHKGYKLYYPVYGDNLSIHRADGQRTVMTGEYRIDLDVVPREQPTMDHKPSLFYLPDDPGESRDLSEQNPEIVNELKEMLDTWYEEVMKENKRATKYTLINPED